MGEQLTLLSQEQIERSLQLETVPEPAPAPNPTGRNQHTKPEGQLVSGGYEVKGHDDPEPLDDRTAKRLRAINRAPDVVKDAYREGRISQTLAAETDRLIDQDTRAAALVRSGVPAGEAVALVVEDCGGMVRLHVEGLGARRYGPGLGRKARRT